MTKNKDDFIDSLLPKRGADMTSQDWWGMLPDQFSKQDSATPIVDAMSDTLKTIRNNRQDTLSEQEFGLRQQQEQRISDNQDRDFALKLSRASGTLPSAKGSKGSSALAGLDDAVALPTVADSMAFADYANQQYDNFDSLDYAKRKEIYDDFIANTAQTIRQANPKEDANGDILARLQDKNSQYEPAKPKGNLIGDIAGGALNSVASVVPGVEGLGRNALNWIGVDVGLEPYTQSATDWLQQHTMSDASLDRDKQIAREDAEWLEANPDATKAEQVAHGLGSSLTHINASTIGGVAGSIVGLLGGARLLEGTAATAVKAFGKTAAKDVAKGATNETAKKGLRQAITKAVKKAPSTKATVATNITYSAGYAQNAIVQQLDALSDDEFRENVGAEDFDKAVEREGSVEAARKSITLRASTLGAATAGAAAGVTDILWRSRPCSISASK